MKKRIVLLTIICCLSTAMHGQQIAFKTNLLYGGATFTPNLGVEVGLGQQTTLNVMGGYNPWNLNGSESSNKKLVHWMVQPEFRYWPGERFDRHFFGIHALGAQYNISGHDVPLLFEKEFRYQGFAFGGGISYGYLWNFAERWGAEFTVGVGVAQLKYDKYDCIKCGDETGNFNKTYFGPTKAGINLVYKLATGARKRAKNNSQYHQSPLPLPQPATTPTPVAEKATPTPAPVVAPVPTKAEKLAMTHPYVVPISDYVANRSGSALDLEQFAKANREGSRTIYFRQGSRKIDRAYRGNAESVDEIIASIKAIEGSADSHVARIVIVGYASPEGSVAINERLASDRAREMSRIIQENSSLPISLFEVYGGSIDWESLRKMVEQSNMEYRQSVLDIIDNTPSAIDTRLNTSRKKELMDLGAGKPWKYMLTNFFPELRSAAYIKVYYENQNK